MKGIGEIFLFWRDYLDAIFFGETFWKFRSRHRKS